MNIVGVIDLIHWNAILILISFIQPILILSNEKANDTHVKDFIKSPIKPLIIISYEMLRKYEDDLKSVQNCLMICDEVLNYLENEIPYLSQNFSEGFITYFLNRTKGSSFKKRVWE